MLVPRYLSACLITLGSFVSAGERTLLDNHWRFQLGDQPGAEAPAFDDGAWRTLDLPHDWGVEASPTIDAPSGGAGGYHQAGIAWYRRGFVVEPSDPQLCRSLEFDGVYQNAEVWLNGKQLGKHAYGYTPFSFDITERVRVGEKNVIAVRVDNSAQPNCRWYSGSGIYRHVWLREHSPVFIQPQSVWVKTDWYDGDRAKITVEFEIENKGPKPLDLDAHITFLDLLGSGPSEFLHSLSLKANASVRVRRELELVGAEVWSPQHPRVGRLELRLFHDSPDGEREIDRSEHLFGIRTIAFDASEGLLINGEPLILFGGNVHHDHGPLGAASFDDAEDRRVRLLKEAGFNAVRTAHNPPSEAFLDACDRRGLLVIEEAFDGWEKAKLKHDYSRVFKQNWREDLAAMVLRDRRHPSVIMWSIGNEMYERGDQSGQQIAEAMANYVRSIDDTRPVTAGVNGLGERSWTELDPLFQSLDMAGYNYEPTRFRVDHKRAPNRVMYGSESYANAAFESWRETTSQPYVVGDFVWSAIDYLGEAGIGRVFPPGDSIRKHWEGEHFPWRASACGDIDLIGRRKPISHYRNIVWDRGEKLYLAVDTPALSQGDWGLTPWSTHPSEASWTWPVPQGAPLLVHAYSRWPEVRYSLNGRQLGVCPTGKSQEFHAALAVPYEPGELVLEGLRDGEVMQKVQLSTAGKADVVELKPSRPTAPANRQTIAFIAVRLADTQGRTQPREDRLLGFSVKGPAEIIAVGNADPASRLSYASKECPTRCGRALVVLRSTGEVGAAILTATADGLSEGHATIEFTRPIR